MRYSTTVARILTAGALMTFAGTAAAQQPYPNKPIRLIVPYPPGGAISPVARLIGQKLSEGWGQQVIVDNRPGGNTIIGTEALTKSPPDGYTILLVASAHVINPNLLSTPYDAIKDFAPVATVMSSGYVLVLHSSVAANGLQEFIALAKSRPGQLNFASSGSGTLPHLAMELFNVQAGVKIQHIPYKGGGPALTDLLGGQVQVHFNVPIGLIPHVKSGKLKAIAVSGESRLLALPQVPTFTQAGLPGFDVRTWQGLLAPVGTPKAIVDRLSAEIAKILAMSDIKTALSSQGMDPFTSTPEQFATLMKADLAKYAKVIKAANIKLDQ